MNPYIQDFYQSLLYRYPKDGKDMSYSEWIAENTHMGGKPFSFEGYEFQKKILDDLSDNMAVIKPSQVGMTEGQIRKCLAFAKREQGTSSIFSLPNDKMYKRVSKTRVRPMIRDEKVFNQTSFDDKPIQSMGLYEIDRSLVYFTGMTEGDATSIPADALFHDEYDLSPMDIVALYQSRLQNSNWKITQAFSTPTHPGYGVDSLYLSSDRHEYMHRCDSCNHWQVPKFTPTFVRIPDLSLEVENYKDLEQNILDSVSLEGAHVACEKCDKPLDLGNPDLREWVPEKPEMRSRGYRIRPFSSGRLPVKYVFSQLAKYSSKENLKGFHNTVLGEAYSDGSNQLQDSDLDPLFSDPSEVEIGKLVPCAIGIDVGKVCNLVLGPIEGDFAHSFRWMAIPEHRLLETIGNLLNDFNIVAGGIDRHPYTPLANAVMALSKDVIVPVEYRGTSALRLVEDEFKNLSHAQADRTAMIDFVVRQIRRRSFTWKGYGAQKQTIKDHLMDMVRIEADEKPATWEKLTGNDHYFHAKAFQQIAIRIKKLEQSKVEQSQVFRMMGVGTVGNIPSVNQYLHSLGTQKSTTNSNQTLGTKTWPF